MTPPTFYDSPAKIAALHAAAAALEGTPFFPNSEAPGRDGGIDCVHTLHWLDRTCGAIERVDIPPQVMDWGQHAERSLLIEAFETWPQLKHRYARVPFSVLCPPSSVLLPGDVLCFLAGKVPHHGAKYLGHGEILQALRGPGVHTMRLGAVVRGRLILGYLAAIYRPLPLPISELRTPISDTAAP